jgi:predicted DCC family thiol-disulfide oxidoreductase YuxK
MTPALYKACARAVHVITPTGQTLRAGRAVLCVMEVLGWRRMTAILSLPPLVWLVELGYRIVADHRPFFGRFVSRR